MKFKIEDLRKINSIEKPITITRKIGVIPVCEDNFTETDISAYKNIRDIRYHVWLMSNHIMTNLYILDKQAKQKFFSLTDSERESTKISQVKKDIILQESNGTCKTISNYAYFLSKAWTDKIPSSVRSSTAMAVSQKFQNDLKEVSKGLKTVVNYRLKNVNIPFATKVGYLIDQDSKLYFNPTIKGFPTFALIFGKDRSNNREIFARVMTGEYRLCDSYFKFDSKGKLYLYIVVQLPVREVKLDDTLSVGVDLGISVPAVCALSRGKARKYVGNGKFLQSKRRMFDKRKKFILESTNGGASGGKGRNKKLRHFDQIKSSESLFFKGIDHNLSKEIINFALRHRAGVIKLEFLKGFADEHKDNTFLRDWTYFQLQNFVEVKAKKYGIKVVYIDPYHTSQTCSVCGHWEKGQRLTRDTFQCNKCGEKLHADYNAAVNIANSDKIVTKKEHCTISKLSQAS